MVYCHWSCIASGLYELLLVRKSNAMLIKGAYRKDMPLEYYYTYSVLSSPQKKSATVPGPFRLVKFTRKKRRDIT